ncbi:MAG: iron transporter [Deltaproteobacteria bacterium]|nr:MAG: iron transporter [Deltaproteobacteria bacterium]
MTYWPLLNKALSSGARKGWGGFVWMIKILVPISFLTAVLAWSGWLERSDFLLQPIMSWLSLPPAAALPLLIGVLTGIYGAIAAMVVLPLSKEQMTLIAIFLLIAHNLIQEGVVQGKSGLHPAKATIFRLSAAILTVMISALFFDTSATPLVETGPAGIVTHSFAELMGNWLLSMSHLSAKIFVIIMSLLILLEVLKSLGWIDYFVRLCQPLLRTLGLSDRAGILWMTAAVFGLAYGAAIIVEEAKEGHLDKEELEELHLSIGINHALVEDPALFLALGLNAFWLWIPRLITAMLAVRLLSLWRILSRTRQS